uniref:ATP synthase complex subunit 8 n=2 Tax=Monochamus alternatus TaxID=192382 RepID=A0A0U1WNJ6_MONAT|nr:ATP synthase F0 subunit 8 [Monochamus alternatus]YP_009913595.1 ATP synthase F0 subunit 8 [Monochamus alternatus alternatus]AIG22810.1 ATP synthase F0 subunit 8 [Monochamus alternatus]QLM01481.1 ATP synthase F0 subunit 8 [Monochamus alternatus alternatus]QWM97275.1 ATP synthase F0 subunit 8 [Monochamus alternatus]
MPQMAPLSWLILFLFFIFIYLIFNIINFYSFNYSIKSSIKNKSSLSYNWKW